MVTDPSLEHFKSKIFDICAENNSSSERINKLSLSLNGTILLDGEIIPYELLPSVYKLFSSTQSNLDDKYILYINGQKLTYQEILNNFEFKLNEKYHNPIGPAVCRDNIKYHYSNGNIHNVHGPAVIGEFHNKYYLYGNEKTFFQFIVDNPETSIKLYARGSHIGSVYKWKDYAIIDGIDGSRFFCHKGEHDVSDIGDFFLELVSCRVPGYKVLAFEKLGSILRPIYEFVNSNQAHDWKVVSTPSYSKLTNSHSSFFWRKAKESLYFKSSEFPASMGDTTFKVDLDFNKNIIPYIPEFYLHKNHNGLLHAENGPAIKSPTGETKYYIFDYELSKEEHIRYNKEEQSLFFYNNDGLLHRDHDDPAVMFFDPNGWIASYWYKNGLLHRKNAPAIVYKDGSFEFFVKNKRHNSDGPAVGRVSDNHYEYWHKGSKINLLNREDNMTGTPSPQAQFEEALRRVKSQKTAVKENGVQLKTASIQHGTAGTDADDSRFKQVTSGAKLGIQKAAIRKGSEKAAEAIAEFSPYGDSVALQRVVQLMLLFGSAELIERLPDASSKIGLSQDRREAFGGLSRYVAGETLGRDAVEIVSFITPMLLDKLQDFSAEEINELASEAAQFEKEETQKVK